MKVWRIKLLNSLKKYGLESKVIISSFNHLSIERVKVLNPNLALGALVEHEGLEMQDTIVVNTAMITIILDSRG